MNTSADSDSFSGWKKDDDCDDEEDAFEYSPKRKLPRLDSSEDIIDEAQSSGNDNEANANESKKPFLSSKGSFGHKYMLKLGHKEGRGLGKYQDGIVEPVEASKQKGRRGIGFKAVDLESAVSKYDPTLEIISIDEEVNWLSYNCFDTLNKNLLESWIKMGQSKKSIDNSSFCEGKILSEILSSKTLLDAISPKELENGRRRSNPFESIQKGIFLNRAAMKMANLDAILGRMFTEPRDKNGEKIIGPGNLLYFADVCAGPGGFSEYIFFRKKWRAKGFGFTLRNSNDFKLDEFWAGPSETFEPHYGSKEDGNIFLPENLTSFKNHVLKYTDGEGVHFMMADGGIEIKEKFNDQELIHKKLYLCQCLLALLIVRTEGHFVVKLFDLFTTFSVGLVYLMYRSFREISIIKPNTSRPANSERYLVCKYKREDCGVIGNHLFEINKKVARFDDDKVQSDVLELVPMDVLLNDEKFFNYIYASNNRIGRNQIQSLLKLAKFSDNTDLKDERQQELRKKCLEKWDIPDEARAEPKKYDARTKCTELMGFSTLRDLDSDAKNNTIYSCEAFTKSVISKHDWRFIVLNGEKDKNTCAFYLGLGRNNIHKYTPKGWKKWCDGFNIKGLCLPANTLVYGELVAELVGQGRGQVKRFAFHIIDGMFLGGEDIRHLPIKERWKICKLFAKSLHKDSFPVRMKKNKKLKKFESFRQSLVLKWTKSSSPQNLCVPLDHDFFYRAGGILFFRDTKGSWHRFFSSSAQQMYLHNCDNNNKFFENSKVRDTVRNEVYAEFEQTFHDRMIWWWDSGVAVHDDQLNESDPNKFQARDLSKYLAKLK